MKKYWALFWAAALAAGVVTIVGVFAKVSGRTLLDIGLGAASLYWLLVITTVPWNLYFRARDVRHEIDVSQERGLRMRAGHEAEVRRLEWWLLRLAIGGHVVSAVVVAAVTYFSGHVLGYYFAAFYLLSGGLRPGAAYLGHVRARIARLLRETTHPREDVIELTTRFTRLSSEVAKLRDATGLAQEQALRELAAVRDELRGTAARLHEDVRHVRDSTEKDRDAMRERIAAVERRASALVAHFDAAVDGLTDQQELLNGIPGVPAADPDGHGHGGGVSADATRRGAAQRVAQSRWPQPLEFLAICSPAA
jgi:hypothetical protein